MATKGTDKSCGCPGCGTPLVDAIDPFVPWDFQTTCCTCFATQICVSIDCGYDRFWGQFNWGPCAAGGTGRNSYAGSIQLASGPVDLDLQFQIVGGQCYLVLSSSALGIYGTEDFARVLITNTVRKIICPQCQTCDASIADDCGISFPISAGGCSRICVRPAPNTSLTPVGTAPECPQPYYGRPCGGPCKGCKCICTTVCMIVEVDGQVVTDDSVRIDPDNYTYSDYYGYQVAIVSDNGCCALQLTGFGPYTPVSQPALVPIGNQTTTNPCPDIYASFLFNSTNGHAVQVWIFCAGCDGKCGAGSATRTCCDKPLPVLLYTDFQITGATGPCTSDFLIPVIFQRNFNYWYGERVISGFGTCKATFSCGVDSGNRPVWVLQIETPCWTLTRTAPIGDCTLLNLSFDFGVSTVAFCCDAGTLTVGVTP